MKRILIVSLIFCLSINYAYSEEEYNSIDRAVLISAEPDEISNTIKLNWNADSNAIRYYVRMKNKNDTKWQDLAVFGPDTTTYTYDDLIPGTGYEFYIEKWTDVGYDGYGYVYTGVRLPEVDNRGKALIVADNVLYDSLKYELGRFASDLRGDGYEPVIKTAPRSEQFSKENVAITKSIIDSVYSQDTSALKAVILVGRIAVPYSGNNAWDGHKNHKGAWPSDAYYAVFSDGWTDNTVDYDSALRVQNHNIPGDGKFDQNTIPADVKFAIGRIDFYNLPSFGDSETELLKHYFDKDHAYRFKEHTVSDRVLIDDGFNMYSNEAFASDAWFNFYPYYGPDRIDTGRLRYVLKDSSYQWAYACNQGGYNSILYSAYAEDFAAWNHNGVFTILFGSYAGDWDSEDNVMRSALASQPSILTCFWDGRPFWYIQHMFLGETIGYSTVLTQNNKTLYLSSGPYGLRGTHAALMGDPTLREHVAAPPENLRIKDAKIIKGARHIELEWDAPDDDNIAGYNIFRAEYPGGTYVKLNDEPVPGTYFPDDSAGLINNTYMVRTVELQKTPVGSYYNMSQGRFISHDFHDSSKTYLITIPNPVYSYLDLYVDLPSAARVRIDIFDYRGALVKEFKNEYLDEGVTKLKWDLTDKYSNRVAAGIYFVRMTSPGFSWVAKISVLP